MHFSKFFTALASFTSFANSMAVIRQSDEPAPLEKWQVTVFGSFSPSGRPNSSTLANIRTSITNPSPIPAGPGVSFDPSSAKCYFEWDYFAEEPYGNVYECTTDETEPSTSSSGTVSKWTVELFEVNSTWPSATENVDAKYTLTTDLTVDGQEYHGVFSGTTHFEVGDNMRGTCGGSGVCSWGLKEESIPVLVQPTVVS